MHTVFGLVEDDAVLAFEHFFGDFDAVQSKLLMDVATHLGFKVVVSGQAVHELAVRVAGHFHHLFVDLVRHEEVDALFPDLGGFAHGYPHVGVEEVAAFNALLHVVGDGDFGAGFFGDLLAGVDEFLVGLQFFRSHDTDIHAHLGAAHHQRVTHVETGVAAVSEGDLVEGFVGVFHHGEEVGEDLGGVELVGEAVPYWHASIFGQFFNDVLTEATVLDAVEHTTQHAGGVLHRFLDTDL